MNFFDALFFYHQQFWSLIESAPFLLTVMSFSFSMKLYFLVNLIVHGRNTKNQYIKRSSFFLILILFGAMTSNFTWILKVLRVKCLLNINKAFCSLAIRLAWPLMVLQYHSLALFMESLVKKTKLFGTRQKVLICTSILLATCLFTVLLIAFVNPNKANSMLTRQMMDVTCQYCVFPVLLLSLFVTLKQLRTKKLPRLLHKQTTLFVKAMIIPFLFIEILTIYAPSAVKFYPGNRYAFSGISALVLLYALAYCAKKVVGLRFLNIYSHAGQAKGFDFIKNFRLVLEQFSNVTNIQELQHITRTFFHQAFSIPIPKTHLYILPNQLKTTELLDDKKSLHERVVDKFLLAGEYGEKRKTFFQKNAVLFTDEVAFNQFYNKKDKTSLELLFLQELNADAFIPIVHNNQLLGYIIIDRHARLIETRGKQEFYGETERDYMVVFVDHLRNIIYLLQNKKFDSLLYQEKKLEQMVYLKHQELNQYKESVQSFMGNSHNKTGILFYKNRRFIPGNKNAHELIPIDINTQNGHSITKALKAVAQQVLKYKSEQSHFIDCSEHGRLVVSGMPNAEKNNVILLVHPPEVSDLLQKKKELLHNPTDWNFLLWLETTKAGQQIHHLFPGSGEAILNFKINILRLAISKNPLLLDVPEEDLPSLVDLLHRISLRDQLHTIYLRQHSIQEAAVKIFGLNPILGCYPSSTPLLEKINNGTLFIQDIDLLDLKTQKHLADFLQYGMYNRLQSDRKIPSSARIICSTSKNLRTLLQEGTFYKPLFKELHLNCLSAPSLVNLSQKELGELICSLTRQTIAQNIFDGLLELNGREKRKLLEAHPSSFKELRTKLKHILVEKSKRRSIDKEEELFNPAYAFSDPDLVEASRLGKHALRDPRIMGMLWNKFKNQNKIALFLGVNRSSVNRRCKKYGLI